MQFFDADPIASEARLSQEGFLLVGALANGDYKIHSIPQFVRRNIRETHQRLEYVKNRMPST
jgi:hypothetical protein